MDNFCMNCESKVKKEMDSGKIKNEEVEIRVSQIIPEYKIKKKTRKNQKQYSFKQKKQTIKIRIQTKNKINRLQIKQNN